MVFWVILSIDKITIKLKKYYYFDSVLSDFDLDSDSDEPSEKTREFPPIPRNSNGKNNSIENQAQTNSGGQFSPQQEQNIFKFEGKQYGFNEKVDCSRPPQQWNALYFTLFLKQLLIFTSE